MLTQGLKPQIFWALTARLKPRPDTCLAQTKHYSELRNSGQAKRFRQHVGDVHLHVVGLAAKDDSRVCAEFRNHLAASAAGRAWHVIFRDHGNALQLELALDLVDGVENGRALSADGEAIRGVFHVASGIEVAVVSN